jgi:2-(1,2-epoxy-1,2-dihydrophenyl)acetyl-CoA isomerase
MGERSIDFSFDDGVARIVIDDVEAHNAIGARLTRELAQAAIACEGAAGLRVVLLTARGEKFSVGGNLAEFLRERDHLRPYVREMAGYFHQAITILHRLPVPVVCGVNGIAAGGGMSLVCMSDLAIATRSARFNLAYTRSGLTPDGGATWFLPRLVGLQRAFDLMATNPTLSAAEACAIGLIARVVDDADYPDALAAVVAELAAAPAAAVGRAKRLLRAGLDRSLEQQLELEGQSIADSLADPATLDALEAFFASRRK